MERKTSLILAAGGRGTRFSSSANVPKQLIELHGYPIFVWSLQSLLSSPAVANAVIVAPPDLVTTVKRQLDRLSGKLPEKEVRVVPGGSTRQESVYLGLLSLEQDNPEFVLIHDAARPFVSAEIAERCVTQLLQTGACTTSIAVSDTVKRTDGTQVVETLDRESLILVQTPQGGRYDWLLEAHRLAVRDEKATTDDAAILELAGHTVSIVDGATYNLKITRPEDLVLAEALAAILFADRL